MGKSMSEGEVDLGVLLPKEINGWEAKAPDEFYDPNTIFDYINGAGEVYRAYNFERLLARHFTKEAEPRIIADLFDMGTAKNAFGVFTHDPEGEDVGIGQDSTYKGGLLSFWKGRFFISLYAEEETEGAKATLMALGKMVASSIKQEGIHPDLVSLFPRENLKERRIQYFYNHLILNYHFFVADENILFLGRETEAALAAYKEGNEIVHVLLVRYPGERKAGDAYKSFIQAYMPEAKDSDLIRTENDKWTAVRLKGDLLIIVFDAPSGSQAEAVIARILERSE
ncbi:MAG: hypothetical protein OEY18_08150 [Candidatus Aminicenantes bacterium]|nr:hypothetical protein [Candidatus Aminicenantes bacterium]MDH5743037.1 hypothetical protein [Candidatus Aminicenantes bacterium]